MSSMVRFSSVTMACSNPGALAAFYAAISDGEVTFVHGMEWTSRTINRRVFADPDGHPFCLSLIDEVT